MRRTVKKVELLINHYAGNSADPTRQLRFTILESYLKKILRSIGDGRNVGDFLKTYDSMEAGIVYNCACEDNKIIARKVTYSDAFEMDYNNYVCSKLKESDSTPLFSKSSYYWNIYCLM